MNSGLADYPGPLDHVRSLISPKVAIFVLGSLGAQLPQTPIEVRLLVWAYADLQRLQQPLLPSSLAAAWLGGGAWLLTLPYKSQMAVSKNWGPCFGGPYDKSLLFGVYS